jgi:hypothetical protein
MDSSRRWTGLTRKKVENKWLSGSIAVGLGVCKLLMAIVCLGRVELPTLAPEMGTCTYEYD